MKLASLEPTPTQRTAAPRGRTGLEMVLGEQLGFQGRSLVLLVKQNGGTLVREGQSGGSDPCAPLMGGGLENSFSCGLVKITFTGCLCIKMCPTPPWFLLLQALSLVWPLWSEIKGIFLLQGCPPMAKSQMLPSHPSPTFCLSSNLSPLGSFKPQIPFFKFFFSFILLQGPCRGCGIGWPQFPPCPLCRDKKPLVPVAVSSARVRWLWPKGVLRMALCSLF